MEQPERKIEPAEKTYWFERPGGSIVEARAKEAWEMYKRKGFKLIGVSDGKLFQQAVRESVQLQQQGDVEGAQKMLREARKAELEAGRGNIELPPDNDVKGPAAQMLRQQWGL